VASLMTLAMLLELTGISDAATKQITYSFVPRACY
jgi:hypothetical protein